jgi:hypothetical protein
MTNGFTVVTAMLGAGFQRAAGRYKWFLPPKIAERMQKIFDVIAESQKEIHAEELYRSVIRASLFLRHSSFAIF